MKIISFLFCSSYLLYGASHAHSPSDFSVPNPMQPATEEVLPKETTREAVPQKTKKKERKRPLFMYSLTPDLRGKAKFLKEKQPHNKEAEKLKESGKGKKSADAKSPPKNYTLHKDERGKVTGVEV